MDARLKKQIDEIFEKLPGNMICLALYGNIDYGDRAREEYWIEHIDSISHELSLNLQYIDIKLDNTAIFANLGLEDIADEDINKISKLANKIRSILPWDVHDFDGEVNEYWYGLVVVTKDYKVLRVNTTGSHNVLYRDMIGDLAKMDSEAKEKEKLAINFIENAANDIKSKFKDVKTAEGRTKVQNILAKLESNRCSDWKI